jgi:hypothetical protein
LVKKIVISLLINLGDQYLIQVDKDEEGNVTKKNIFGGKFLILK